MVEIKDYERNDAWKQHRKIYGSYEINSGTVNGKPHYSSTHESGKYGIWQNRKNQIIIGLTADKTSSMTKYEVGEGFAYNNNKDTHYCPYGPAFDWFYKGVSGFWREADEGITIQCMS